MEFGAALDEAVIEQELNVVNGLAIAQVDFFASTDVMQGLQHKYFALFIETPVQALRISMVGHVNKRNESRGSACVMDVLEGTIVFERETSTLAKNERR